MGFWLCLIGDPLAANNLLELFLPPKWWNW